MPCPLQRPLPTGYMVFLVPKLSNDHASFRSAQSAFSLLNAHLLLLSCHARCSSKVTPHASFLCTSGLVPYAALSLGLSTRWSLQRSTAIGPVACLVKLAYAYAKGCATVTAFDSTMLSHCSNAAPVVCRRYLAVACRLSLLRPFALLASNFASLRWIWAAREDVMADFVTVSMT